MLKPFILFVMVRSRHVRGRAWCFTCNNFTDVEVDRIRHLQVNERVRYLVLQEELADSQTPHLQGYVELFRPMLLSGMKKLISERVHWEPRRGTQSQAVAYSKKVSTRVVDGIVIEFGTLARSKCSVDLVNSVINGASMKDIALDYPTQFISNSGGIKALKEAIVDPRKWAMQIVVYWGDTGTGKTFSAWQKWPEAYSVSWPVGNTWWWQDYDGEDTVICDEFASQVKLQTMLRFLDRTPFRVFYKGGSTQFRSKRIVIVSNFDPLVWYSKCSLVGLAALKRRLVEFGKVYHFTTRFEGVGTPVSVLDDRFEEVIPNNASESSDDDDDVDELFDSGLSGVFSDDLAQRRLEVLSNINDYIV